MPEDKGLASAAFLELKYTSLAHGHWVAIFEAVNNATFDAMGGITNFILKDWLGNIDPPSREVPVKTHFKRPKLQCEDFDVGIDDEDDVEIQGVAYG